MAKTIVIFEQDQDVKDIMEYVLKDSGYEVAITNSNVFDINISKCKPDLILLDYRLTKPSCPSLLDILRSRNDNEQVPVILTTTENQPEKIAHEVDADDVLPKPFDLDDLVQKVSYWVK